MVGAVGIEPTTFGLKGRCSTTELRPYIVYNQFVSETDCTTLVLSVPELSPTFEAWKLASFFPASEMSLADVMS
jgi:hypothetical protein